jgi:hypothetical protein
MATGRIYNGFGQYEERKGEKGITLRYGGVEFWLPYQKVTAIPNYTFYYVDHDKSTPEHDEKGELVYQIYVVPGQRIVEELTMTQIPVPNKMKGIMAVEGKTTGRIVQVPAGRDSDGHPVFAEVAEVDATNAEKTEAERRAHDFKHQVIQEYFQSKRERMTGGKGRLNPEGMVRVFMDELNVADLDDVTTHQKQTGGIDIELIKVLVEEMRKGSEVNAQTLKEAIESVRKAGKAQFKSRPKSLNLAEHARQFDEQHSAEREE